MCGVAGIIRSDPGAWSEEDRARMERAVARLGRRGPDGSGVRSAAEGRALLGHTRLAIQDLSSAAAQPMSTPDGTLIITYNGELYNASEVRGSLEGAGRRFRTRSDTEVLLHALAEWGLRDTLDRVIGMFAFVAVEHAHGRTRVMAAVDPAGMKPLTYRFRPGGGEHGPTLAFASDCDALRELMAEPARIDPVGLCHVLSVGYCPAPWTVWGGVRKLAPGTLLEWDLAEAEPRVGTYWRPPEELRERVLGSDGTGEEVEELIVRVSREHLVGDVPVGMFLSAGLDSTSIALALRSGMGAPSIRAYTLNMGAPTDETVEAGRVAGMLGMEHEAVAFASGELASVLRGAVARFDEPQGFSALLTATRIADAMRAGTSSAGAKVVLTGDGGDETFGGYAWHRDPLSHPLGLGAFTPPIASDVEEHRRMTRLVAGPDATSRSRVGALHALGRLSYTHRYLVRTFGGFHPAEASALLRGLDGAAGAEFGYDEEIFAGWLGSEDRAGLPPPRRAQRLDILGFCAGSIQPKLDRACMGVGLELRAPYLDRRLIEQGIGASVGPHELEPGGSKPAIRRILARGVERGRIPGEILRRPKQGFSLKLPGGMEELEMAVDESRLVREGGLRRDWRRFLVDDAELRRVRVFTLAMVAAWFESRG